VNLLYRAYAALTGGLFLACFPPFWIYTRLSGRYKKDLKERLGYLPPHLFHSLLPPPRIWIHAVSLGEVGAAAPIIGALRVIDPRCSVILSTTTEHGRKLAQNTFGQKIPVVYAPIDFVGSVRKALCRVRPDVLVFLETEIWPVWIAEARRMQIKIALVNGRISVRSIGGYLKFRPFFREVLNNIDCFSMIGKEDAERIMALGAEPGKIRVSGNAKFDGLAGAADPSTKKEMRQIVNVGPSQRVFVAGSTRGREQAMVLEAFKEILRPFPDTILIIAPRHISRVPEIESLIEKSGLTYQLWSKLARWASRRTEPVIIVDVFGVLFKIYSIASVTFCGGSLVPLGGQNPLEAAAWGSVVIYGPSMEDFLDAKALLEKAGAGMTVSSPKGLAEKVIWLFNHPDALYDCGRRGRQAVVKNSGAAQKHAMVIAELTGQLKAVGSKE